MSTPQYLRELADMVDHEKLWRLSGIDREKLTADQKKRLDAGVALRRHATDLQHLCDAYAQGKSVVITPLSPRGLSRTTCLIAPPPAHQKLRDES